MLGRENKVYIKRLTPAKPITLALTKPVQKIDLLWLTPHFPRRKYENGSKKESGSNPAGWRQIIVPRVHFVWQLFNGLHLALCVFETAPIGSNFTAEHNQTAIVCNSGIPRSGAVKMPIKCETCKTGRIKRSDAHKLRGDISCSRWWAVMGSARGRGHSRHKYGHKSGPFTRTNPFYGRNNKTRSIVVQQCPRSSSLNK